MNVFKHDVSGLIEANRSYAHAIAGDILHKLAPSADREEVRGAAELGLVEAANAFDSTRGVSFKTFAYYRIRGAVYDLLRKTLGRGDHARLSFEAAANDYLGDLAGAPASGGSAAADFERLKEVAGGVMACYLLSIDQMPHELADRNGETPEEIFGRSESRRQVREAMAKLPEKNRRLIEDYYFADLSLEEIGAKMGLSKSWVCRLHAKSLEMLREILGRQRPADATIVRAAR
jgi:RNA polymerase sigma factor for flagellar operon FliA